MDCCRWSFETIPLFRTIAEILRAKVYPSECLLKKHFVLWSGKIGVIAFFNTGPIAAAKRHCFTQ